MNQQRARRFKTAKDEEKNKEIEERLRNQLEEKGEKAPESKNRWDSNLITPGTLFMDKVSKGIRWYIHDRLNNYQGWKGLTVIFSDAQVPGEGEHKIAEFIRIQRAQKGYNPKTRHCIYGLDADLIMLALATHEPNFTILREKVFLGGKHFDVKKKEEGKSEYEYKPFQFLHVDILRYNLQREFSVLKKADFERIIDDFVFICFFVGNDFLPHLPSLDIKEGAIDFLLRVYKQEFFKMGGYLVEGPKIHFERVEMILKELAQTEDNIFYQRLNSQRKMKEARERRKKQGEDRVRENYLKNPELLQKLGEDTTEKDRKRKRDIELLKQNMEASNKLKQALQGDLISLIEEEPDLKKVKTDEFIEPKEVKNVPIVIEEIKVESPSTPNSSLVHNPFQPPKLSSNNFLEVLSKTIYDAKIVDEEKHPDDVLLGERGWKQRYYQKKFKIPLMDDYTEEHKAIFRSYTEGLSWVMRYYYEGCPSWCWYYPYHYAPFSSDLTDLSKHKIEFEKGIPFNPFSQLLAVFPSNSSSALPLEYSKLMTEKESPISDFYPKDFEIDLNGKRFEYQGVVLLPFIEEDRLLKAIDSVKDTLTEDEKRRNSRGQTQIYANTKHNALGPVILDLIMGDDEKIEIPETFHGCRGFLERYDGAIAPSDDIDPPFKSYELKTIKNNLVMSASFHVPPAVEHLSKLLEGSIEFKEIEDKMDDINVPTRFGSSKYSYKKENEVFQSRDPRGDPREYQQRDQRRDDNRRDYERRTSDPRSERGNDQRSDPRSDRYEQRRDSREYNNDRRDQRYDNRRDQHNHDRRDTRDYNHERRNDNRDQRHDNRRDDRRDNRLYERRDDRREYQQRDNRRDYERRDERRTSDPRSDRNPYQTNSYQSYQTTSYQSHPYQTYQNNQSHPYQVETFQTQQQQQDIQRNIQEILEKIPNNYSLLPDDQNNQ